MKKALVASILGIVASVATTFGQGTVNFNNYANNGYNGAPVLYGPGSGGTVGNPVVGGQWNNQLAFAFGTVSDPAGGLGGINGAFTLSSLIVPGLGQGASPAGTLVGPLVSIPGYTSGPITFEWLSFNGADYASSAIRGHSAAFTLSSIATGQAIPGFLDGMASFQIVPVPEPATFALAGLGAAAMLIIRRRK